MGEQVLFDLDWAVEDWERLLRTQRRVYRMCPKAKWTERELFLEKLEQRHGAGFVDIFRAELTRLKESER